MCVCEAVTCYAVINTYNVVKQECIKMGTKVRVCNSVKFETGRNLQLLKIVTHAGHAA